MAANDPFELTAAEARALMDKGELSPLDLTESCLSRIDAHEDALRAWAHVDREGAVAAARRAGDELLVIGRKSPLHGIPIGIKDIYRTNGLPTEMGSRSWAGYVPNFDCTAVARLKQAGAIVLGKTVTTEFAMLQPSPTYNPWNPDHTPGGSSSGSGASVAARMTPLAIGSQTGGSVLRPAAYNGVVGLKPTLGRISCYGVLPISHVMDHPGTFTRSVEDAADFLQVIAGFDAFDPYTVDMPVPDYRAALDQPLSPPRIGLARGFFFDNADEETRRHTEQIAQRLADAGAIVEDVDVPESLADVRLHHKVIMDTDAATVHKDTYRDPQGRHRPPHPGDHRTRPVDHRPRILPGAPVPSAAHRQPRPPGPVLGRAADPLHPSPRPRPDHHGQHDHAGALVHHRPPPPSASPPASAKAGCPSLYNSSPGHGKRSGSSPSVVGARASSTPDGALPWTSHYPQARW